MFGCFRGLSLTGIYPVDRIKKIWFKEEKANAVPVPAIYHALYMGKLLHKVKKQG
jgi:hypothetical protein